MVGMAEKRGKGDVRNAPAQKIPNFVEQYYQVSGRFNGSQSRPALTLSADLNFPSPLAMEAPAASEG